MDYSVARGMSESEPRPGTSHKREEGARTVRRSRNRAAPCGIGRKTGIPYRMLLKFDDILACCASYPRSIPLNLPWPSLAMSLVVDVGWMLDNDMHCFTQKLVVVLEVPTGWWDIRPGNKQLFCAGDEFQKEWFHATRRRICRLVVRV